MKRIVLVLLTATAVMSAAEGEIKERKEAQQQRIAQGVKSGSLTPRETANLERREQRINQQIRAERKANGGNLTNREKAQINREQNRTSRAIYNDKHNAAVQPK